MTGRTMIKAAAGILATAAAWTLAHFHIDIIPRDETGVAVYTFAVYVLTSLFHIKVNGNGAPPAVSRAWLVPLLGSLLLAPGTVEAQGTPAQIDSAQRHALELGTDIRMRTDSVTEPTRVRIGIALGPRITVEYTASASRSEEGYFEANASLGLTAALTPGATRFAGAYVAPSILYHYEGGPAQLGAGLELGKRMQVGANVILRAFMFMDDYFATRRLPAITSAGAGAGGSFGL